MDSNLQNATKANDYEELQAEYIDFKETSRLLEEEMERKIGELSRTVEILQKENIKLRAEAEKAKNENERNIHKMIEQEQLINSRQIEINQMKEKVVHLENFSEECAFQKRITESIISELEEKINTLLERLALMQTEFDFNKTEASEQIRLLKDQLRETEFQIQILSIKNSKGLKKNSLKVTPSIPYKILNKKSQSNSEFKTKPKPKNLIPENPKKELFPTKEPNNKTRENHLNVSTPSTLKRNLSGKSFHKEHEKKYESHNNESKPPLRFGPNIIVKNLLKKTGSKQIMT